MRPGARVGGLAKLCTLVGLLGAGCSRTEMIIAISATELTIPDEIDRIALKVTNPRLDPEGARPVFVSPQTAICKTGQAADGTCVTLPTSLTLYPGDAQPNETVRVQLDALLQGKVVLSQASIFSFTKGQTGRLTFDLYRDCLQLECAAVDQACAQGGLCRNLAPIVDSQPVDMASASIVLVGTSSAPVLANAMTFSVPVPNDAVANDHLIVVFSAVFGGNAVLAAPGWKQLTWLDATLPAQPEMWVFERIVAANEPAAHTFVVDSAGAYVNATVHLLHHRGAGRAEGLRTLAASGTTIPSVNVQGDGRVLVALAQRTGDDSPTCPAPTGFVRILNGAVIAYSAPVAAGMTGDRTITCDLPTNLDIVAFALAP